MCLCVPPSRLATGSLSVRLSGAACGGVSRQKHAAPLGHLTSVMLGDNETGTVRKSPASFMLDRHSGRYVGTKHGVYDTYLDHLGRFF